MDLTRLNLKEKLIKGEISVDVAGKFLGLSLEEIEYCKRYNSHRGDSVETVADVYGLVLTIKEHKAEARRLAKKIANNPDITEIIVSQLETSGLNDSFVLGSLHGLIKQTESKSVQLRAIEMYSDLTNLKQRRESENTQVIDYSKYTDAQLDALLELMKIGTVEGESSLITEVLPPLFIKLPEELEEEKEKEKGK